MRTAGRQSKFGIAPEQLEQAAEVVARADARVVGLHAHAGSGIRTPDAWAETAHFLLASAGRFAHVRYVDLGGGFGVVEKPGQRALDLAAVDAALAPIRAGNPDVRIWIEPGRYLVSEAGALLARVTQTKEKGPVRYVGVDAGMHTLIRPALYGAFHEIRNLSRLGAPVHAAYHVVGPICETGDVLGHARPLPESMPGDVLVVGTAGAYGASMASDYNLRGRAREVLID